MNRTKIVCTLGPASCSPEVIRQLIDAGMNVARLNFSHGTQDEKGEVIERIRTCAREAGRSVAILQDLAGPKIRTGKIADGPVELESGQEFVLTGRQVAGDAHRVSVTYGDLAGDVSAGDTLLLSDGSLELKVESVEKPDIRCRVVVGGELSSSKGINLPSGSVRIPFPTEKDRDDLALGLRHGVDYVAISFVRTAGDIDGIRKLVAEHCDRRVPLIAKIEKHESLADLDAIVDAADGVMVARGDLGVEIPIERVPGIQKRLIHAANRKGKTVITATQMLKSMVENPRPTRAEVSDVANAVLDGTDAVMLSEESAVGDYPVASVEMMAKVAADIETRFPFLRSDEDVELTSPSRTADAVARAACHMADSLSAAALITCTSSGSTTRLVAKYRPKTPILGLTPDAETYRALSLVWGVTPLMLESVDNLEGMEHLVLEVASKSGRIRPGDTVVVTAGIPLNVRGRTNLIRVMDVPEAEQPQ